jgi:hypothetical protein
VCLEVGPLIIGERSHRRCDARARRKKNKKKKRIILNRVKIETDPKEKV